MGKQLYRPDGSGGLELRPGEETAWRTQLRSRRWGAALEGGRLPELRNPEMHPTSSLRSVAFWGALALLTFVAIVAGYGSGIWSLPA